MLQKIKDKLSGRNYSLPYDLDLNLLAVPSIRGEIEINVLNFKETEIIDYSAKSNYKRIKLDEIDLIQNDRLRLLKKIDQNVFICENIRTRIIGMVRLEKLSKYEDFLNRSWYFPFVTREDTERLFDKYGNDYGNGLYLIRNSSYERSFGLSLLTYNGKKHYLIKRSNTGEYYISAQDIQRQIKFKSLEKLIKFFVDNQGLDCRLTIPCPKSEGLPDIWELNRKDLEIDRRASSLGSGFFSVVLKAKYKGKHIVAIKEIKQTERNELSQNQIKKIVREESEILKKLKHDKIIKLYGVCTLEEPFYIVFEFMSNGSLKNYLKSKRSVLKYENIIDMATQICSGMKYLEEINLVHLDLAARNILVGEDNLVKIADFGLSKKLNDQGRIYTNIDTLTTKWTAPEIFLPNAKFTTKSDVWSFGYLLYEMITYGEDPFNGMHDSDIKKQKISKNFQLPNPEGICNKEYYDIILKCMKYDPQERYTFDALYGRFRDFKISIENNYVSN